VAYAIRIAHDSARDTYGAGSPGSPWAGCDRTPGVAARAPPRCRPRAPSYSPYCCHYSSRPASTCTCVPYTVLSQPRQKCAGLPHAPRRLIVCWIVRSPRRHATTQPSLRCPPASVRRGAARSLSTCWWSGEAATGCGRYCWRCLYGVARTPSATTRARVSMPACSTGWTTSSRRRVLRSWQPVP
jgi:hypothetical protein